MEFTFGVIDPTRATISPWTPVRIVGPSHGGLPHRISANVAIQRDELTSGRQARPHVLYVDLAFRISYTCIGYPPLWTKCKCIQCIVHICYRFHPLGKVLSHSKNRLICNHEVAETLIDLHLSIDGRTQVALREREGCRYSKALSFADVSDPFNLLHLIALSHDGLRQLHMGLGTSFSVRCVVWCGAAACSSHL